MSSSYEKLYVDQVPVRIQRFIDHNSENHIHWHDEIELLYFTHGHAVTNCNLNEYEVNEGSIVFVNGKEPHAGVVSRAETVYYCIHVNTGFFSNFIGNEYVIFENIINDKDCSALLDDAIKKANISGFRNTIELKRLMYDFFELAAKRHIRSVLNEPKGYFKKLDKFNIILEHIDKHYDEELTVTSLADHFFMSVSYFAHFFKSRSGKTVVQYINETRISHAKSFLESDDMSVGEIAGKTGFSDINYFSRKFKSITEMTPTEYKRH